MHVCCSNNNANGPYNNGNQGVTYVADVCVRSGRWFYEVTIEAPENNTNNWVVSVGFVTQAFSGGANSSALGMDSQGQSWSLTGPAGQYVHRSQQAPNIGRRTTPAGAMARPGDAGDASAAIAKKKKSASKQRGGFSWGGQSVVGCIVDFDNAEMSWLLNGEEQEPVFVHLDLPDGVCVACGAGALDWHLTWLHNVVCCVPTPASLPSSFPGTTTTACVRM